MKMFVTKLNDIDRYLVDVVMKKLKHPNLWHKYTNRYVLKQKYGLYNLHIYFEKKIYIGVEYQDTPGDRYTNTKTENIRFRWYSPEYKILYNLVKEVKFYFDNIEIVKLQKVKIDNLPEQERINYIRKNKLERILDE